jgi:peptidase M1-like protein
VFEAHGVRDFAWVAGPYTRDLEGRTPHGVVVRVLCRRDEKTARRLLDEAVAALETFGARYGAYPYAELTVAETPIDGGMEFPTIFFLGQDVVRAGGATETDVVTHEVAHQWWAMLVGNNGLDDAWIDEGLATYTTASVLDERFAPKKLGLHIPPPLGWVWPSLSFRETIELSARLGDGLWPARPIVGADPPWPDPFLYTAAVYSRAARALFALQDELGRERMDALLRRIVTRYAFRRIDTDQFLAEAREAGASDAMRTALEQPPRDPLRWPRRVRFFALGPFPMPEGLSVGLLPVFGGQRRDQLVAGVRLAAGTPFAVRGPYRPFFFLPRLGVEVDVLRRLVGGGGETVLSGTLALGRQAALEARAELGDDTRLFQAEASWLGGRSAFAGPFWLTRAAVRREEASGLDLLLARTELRLDGTQTLLVPRRGPAVRLWAEAGRDLEADRWAARGGAQAGAFLPLGRLGLGWAGLAVAAARDQPQELSAEEEGWLTAWPDRFTQRLAAARCELMFQPSAPVTLGWSAAGGLLDGVPERLFQTGPSLRLFGELPFSVQLDLPLWTAGGPDEGFAWRWAMRIGPRVAE